MFGHLNDQTYISYKSQYCNPPYLAQYLALNPQYTFDELNMMLNKLNTMN